MATEISFLNNFPVKFGLEEDSCLECDGRDFCQLAEWNDRFEFAYEPSTTDVTVINPNFTTNLTGWSVVGSWTWSAGKARITTSTGDLIQDINHIIGRKYKISFTVSNYTGTGGLSVYMGGVFAVTTASANGSYTFYITPTNSDPFEFASLVATFTLDIDDVTIELVSEDCGIELYNTETGTYSGIRKYANLSSPYISTLGFSYLWSDMGLLYDGCYKIAIFDTTYGSDLIVNGDFATNLDDWSTAGFGGWTWSGGKAFLNTTGIPGELIQQETPVIPVGETIRLTFDITGYVEGEIDVVYDGVSIATITANGSYVIEYEIATGLDYFLSFVGQVDDNELYLDNVTLSVLSCAQSDLSECYKIAIDHGCTTKMLKWTNEDTNGFNYPYYYFYSAANSYGFQWMRVECDLRNAKYPGEAEKYIDSGGNNILYLGSVRKLKDFIVAMMPEYMHDALAVGFKHKAFYIDGVRYTFEDTEYTPEWSSDIPTVLAESTSLVGKYTQDNNSID